MILNSVSLNWHFIVPLYFSKAAFTLCIPQPCLVLSSFVAMGMGITYFSVFCFAGLSWDIGEDQWEKYVKGYVWKVMFLYRRKK